ncbi:RepA family replication protein [Buchnera aphidicola]|uniref:RepA family replication protein n=1 Tax=Buchnera aphidicola TaxID=9 RepID=UPI0021C93292|nr:RepA family replication protein [Buchnera aphidicola]
MNKQEIIKLFNLDEKQAKKKILTVLINHYSTIELTEMGFSGLKKKVDKEYIILKKISKKYFF